MTICDIYNKVNNMKNFSHIDMYKNLIQTYTKTKVDFVMYDLFDYDNLTIEERERRKDYEFKNDVLNRYNNECIISNFRVGLPSSMISSSFIYFTKVLFPALSSPKRKIL